MRKINLFTLTTIFTGILCFSCENKSVDPAVVPKASNITFTSCNEVRNTMEDASERVEVEFTDAGIQIKHFALPVSCDFDTVIISQTLQNGVLNIIEQGEPNNANCICFTDVSYTINGMSENEINAIVINGDTLARADF